MRPFGIVFLFFYSLVLRSQPHLEGYYLFPIKPGEQNFLAGTMGELRSSHFHAGIDIKTGGQTGLPVYAAADGYVSRVKVSTVGYGYALYLSHPNGTTTVYAHLQGYAPDIARYVLENQYQEEAFGIQLFPSRELFPVKKGDIIAYSGNTGSSTGPHLHFEIRDRNQRFLDPLTVGFEEIKDTQAPFVKNLAFVTLEKDARINGTFGQEVFQVYKGKDGIYRPKGTIQLYGKIGIEIYAYDKQDGVYSKNGIPLITLTIDKDTIFQQHKQNMSFAQQRNILCHMDYAHMKRYGKKYDKLFIDDGNGLDFYDVRSDGHYFNDSTHLIDIFFKDSYGNLSVLEARVNHRPLLSQKEPKLGDFKVFRHFLHFKAAAKQTSNLVTAYFGQAYLEISPYQTGPTHAYYVWDLREGLPDSINLCGEVIRTNFFTEIPSGQEISFFNHSTDVHFKKNTLFDTLYLSFEKKYDSINSRELFHFPHADIPLKSYAHVTLYPDHPSPDPRTSVYSVYGHRLNYMGGTWKDAGITFRTRDLVTYTLATDSIAPSITPVSFSTTAISFRISDALSGIASYRATVDGQFVLMKYEPKSRLIWSERLNSNIPFSGEFELIVTDKVGNRTTYNKTF